MTTGKRTAKDAKVAKRGPFSLRSWRSWRLVFALPLLASCASPRSVIDTDRAPKAIGPYSQAVSAGGTVYLAGQIAIDPVTQQFVDGDVRAQTERVLRNLEAVLAASGLTMGHVTKTTVYLTDLKDFPAMNEVYAVFFPKDPPARATVQVAALPKGAKVEIDAVAVR